MELEARLERLRERGYSVRFLGRKGAVRIDMGLVRLERACEGIVRPTPSAALSAALLAAGIKESE